MSSVFAVMMVAEALAQEPAGDPPQEGAAEVAAAAETSVLLIGVRGVGEVWQDPFIAQVYKASRFSGSGVFSWRLRPKLSVEGEVGFFRLTGAAGQAMQMAPISMRAGYRTGTEDVELMVSAGPALVSWIDQSARKDSTIQGSKLGADLQLSALIATGFYDPPAYPAPTIERVDVELFIGRRHHFHGDAAGLNMSAWRIGVGMVARL